MAGSVTRYGEILTMSLSNWQFFMALFSIWQHLELTLAIFYANGQIFIVVNGQMLIKQSSHLVSLDFNFLEIWVSIDVNMTTTRVKLKTQIFWHGQKVSNSFENKSMLLLRFDWCLHFAMINIIIWYEWQELFSCKILYFTLSSDHQLNKFTWFTNLCFIP